MPETFDLANWYFVHIRGIGSPPKMYVIGLYKSEERFVYKEFVHVINMFLYKKVV